MFFSVLQYISDKKFKEISEVMKLGQTVSVYFKSNVLKNGQLARSLRFSHMTQKEVPTGDDILSSFLSDYDKVMESCKKSKDGTLYFHCKLLFLPTSETMRNLADCRVGNVVEVTILESNDLGVTCTTNEGIKGLAIKSHIGEF
jgi:uncharacterized protein (DUF488 family)